MHISVKNDQFLLMAQLDHVSLLLVKTPVPHHIYVITSCHAPMCVHIYHLLQDKCLAAQSAQVLYA